MTETYENVLKQLKKGYQKTNEMLENKEKEKRKINWELININKEIKALNYEASILKNPRNRTQIIVKKNGLGKDIIAFILGIFLASIAIPSIAYLLTISTMWTSIISKALALIASIFIPGYIIYSGINVGKNFQKTTDDIIATDILLKAGSLEKTEARLNANIKKKEMLKKESQELAKSIAILKDDKDAYVISYNTIINKLSNTPAINNIPKPEEDLKLKRKLNDK